MNNMEWIKAMTLVSFEDFKKDCPEVAAKAERDMGSRVNATKFLVTANGSLCAFTESKDRYDWWSFDYDKRLWKETHILFGENWLLK